MCLAYGQRCTYAQGINNIEVPTSIFSYSRFAFVMELSGFTTGKIDACDNIQLIPNL